MNHPIAPVLIGRGLRFAEGINFGRDGTLYCVDVEGGGVWRMHPGASLQEWAPTGGPNGTRFGPDGELYVADYRRKAILRVSTTTGASTVYVDRLDGKPLNGPNDLCFGPDGTLYFSDPFGSSIANPIGAVCAVSPQGQTAVVAAGMAFPNGVAVTPDGSALIVADTHLGALRRYALTTGRYDELDALAVLEPAGEPDAHGENEAGPDGMVFGADGNLYVAHYGAGAVEVVSPAGTIVTTLPAGGATPTNVAFWQDSLYVTDGMSGSVYRLAIGVREQRPFARPW